MSTLANRMLQVTPQRAAALPSRRKFVVGAAAGLALSRVPGARAADFAGKTLTLIAGFPPGGGVDSAARIIAKHLVRFIEGAPTIIVQNMPGAGGMAAASHVFTRAARDGSVLALPGRDWPMSPVLLEPGARYEPMAFEYIGSTGAVNTYVWIANSQGIVTPDDLRRARKRIVFGGLTAGTQPSMTAKILALDGYPLEVVSGYRGMAEVINAIEVGELDAVATNEASFARRPDMAAKCTRVFQLLPSPLSIPLASEHVSQEAQQLLSLTGYASATGMPLVMPPGSPAPLVAIIRDAFAKMSRDPAFEADAKQIGEPYGTPIDGIRIREILSRTMQAATPEVLTRYRQLAAK